MHEDLHGICAIPILLIEQAIIRRVTGLNASNQVQTLLIVELEKLFSNDLSSLLAIPLSPVEGDGVNLQLLAVRGHVSAGGEPVSQRDMLDELRIAKSHHELVVRHSDAIRDLCGQVIVTPGYSFDLFEDCHDINSEEFLVGNLRHRDRKCVHIICQQKERSTYLDPHR